MTYVPKGRPPNLLPVWGVQVENIPSRDRVVGWLFEGSPEVDNATVTTAYATMLQGAFGESE